VNPPDHKVPEHVVLTIPGAQHAADLAREMEQRRKAENALRRSEAEYRSVVDVLSEGIAVIEADGTISSVNESAAQLVNSTREELIGKRLLDLRWHAVLPDGSDLVHAEHPALVTLRTGKPVKGFVLGLHYTEADIHWLSVNTHALRHASTEAPYAVVASFTDVTERLERERQMRDAYDALDQLTSEFMGVVSHELRTPVTALRGALGFLESGVFAELPPKGRELIAIARNNTDRLTRVINNILDLERLKSGRMTFEPSELDVTELVARVMRGYQAAADKKRIVLSTEVSLDTPIVGDDERIAQVLENLVSNAVKFSPPDSSVVVAARHETDAMVMFEVIDTGVGIAPAMLEKLFRSFAQADTSNKRLPGGAGLGLAIAKSTVEQMGGRIGVESEQQVRTRFWFTVPVKLDVA
jgi:PAS domain S-box-containing protein